MAFAVAVEIYGARRGHREGVVPLRGEIGFDPLSGAQRGECPAVVEIEPLDGGRAPDHFHILPHRGGHGDFGVEIERLAVIVAAIVLRPNLPAAELQTSLVHHFLGQDVRGAFHDVDHFVDLAHRPVRVGDDGHGLLKGDFVAVRDFVIMLGQPRRCEGIEIDVGPRAAAASEQQRGIEARDVGKVIFLVVLRVGKLPADEVVALFLGHGKLLIFGVRNDAQFTVQRAAVQLRLHRVGLVGLIKIPILRDRGAVIECLPFSPACVLVPIHALVELEVFHLIRFRIGRESPVLDHPNGFIRVFIINVGVQFDLIIMQHIEVD